MAGRRTGRRTITIVTTTWTIRWWDGAVWVEQTLGPSVAVTVGGEATSGLDEQARGATPAPREQGCESEPNQPAQSQGE
jgi:hypothetical protein